MRKIATILTACTMLAVPAAEAQVAVPGQPMVPLGFCQIASGSLSSAVKLPAICTIPQGATMAYLQAESANVRYRDDGAAPTATVGMQIISGLGGGMLYAGTLANLQFIAASGSPLLDVAFYR